jgi:hypothetical protein
MFSKLRAWISKNLTKLHEIQRSLGAGHIFILLAALFVAAVLAAICFRHGRWLNLSEFFICLSFAALLSGFAALFLDVVNKPEKLGYLLLAASVVCFYWSERQRENVKMPAEIAALVEKSNLLPVSFLKDLWERLNSPIASIRKPATAEAVKILEKPASAQNSTIIAQIAPIAADGLVVAAKSEVSQSSSNGEVAKTKAALEKIKEQLPTDTKQYVQEKIDEAKAKAPEEVTPTATPTLANSPPQDSTDTGNAKAPTDVAEIEQRRAEETAKLSKAKVDEAVKQGGQASDQVIEDAAGPTRKIVETANDAAKDQPADSKNSKDAAVVITTAMETIVPPTSSDLSHEEAVPKQNISGTLETQETGPPPPAPNPNKAQPAKDKKALDDAKSAKLAAELLLAISVIENAAKNSPNKEMPYAQLRELRLRLDSKKNGDLRNLAQPSKDRVLAKLDDLDRRLRRHGGAKARATKKFPQANLLRVGFLFPDENQRLNVRFAQIDLNRNSATPFYCPAIENVGKKGNIPPTTEIRYFEYSIFGWLRPEDAESHAARLAALLRKNIPGIGDVRIVYYKPERVDERPGNFEVWFSRSAFKR